MQEKDRMAAHFDPIMFEKRSDIWLLTVEPDSGFFVSLFCNSYISISGFSIQTFLILSVGERKNFLVSTLRRRGGVQKIVEKICYPRREAFVDDP